MTPLHLITSNIILYAALQTTPYYLFIFAILFHIEISTLISIDEEFQPHF